MRIYSILMRMLERRVQVLFGKDQYRALEQAATSQGQSVGSLIREAVDQRLLAGADTERQAFDRFMALAEASPEVTITPDEWQRLKHLELDRFVGPVAE
ncbi:MAG: hypothetical protein LBG11_09475 [Bifidobacteriaceae bacterium]|jgi:hypothetical protein|nr:hypothetical protein [Bifidobacteriaceae bacterium]